MKILFLGDIVGNPGREAIFKLLPGIKSEYKIDLTIANCENAAGGAGITPSVAEELFKLGCNVLTAGDHIWDRREIIEILDKEKFILRPLNFPVGTPGNGWCIYELPLGTKIAVVSLLGRVFMKPLIECPFRAISNILPQLEKITPIIIIDIHAEATSEKIAMAYFLEGRVSAVVGSHTHVQTADERILPQGSAFITDLGMCGPMDSVIGQKKEKIIERFLTGMPTRFEVAASDIQLQGVVLDIDEKTGKANSIERIQRKVE
ncbi:MAG: TIGR00282 family metallophosphoesterase [Candidatus Omnitrophota bacterium]|nr:TIGR00282 family metallophosphoesterase [Candidatus Omnitrophota bacterium]